MIIAGTGHRPNKLGGYSDKVFQRLIDLALDYLQETKPERVLSGMALGWDQALAEASWIERIPFTAALPFKGQELKWPPPSQARYHDLLDRAGHVHYVSPHGYTAYKLFERNRWLVDKCDRVVALWDGDTSKGGTASAIKYAMEQDVPIDNLWEKWNAN